MKRNVCLRTMIMMAVAGACLFAGCASNQQKTTMTAADEARYAEAIEREDTKQPPVIEPGETVIVNATGDVSEGALAEDTIAEKPAISRSFSVPRAEYDAFFAQSPAVVLGRVELEPIQDGTTLLGYRIKSIRKPFEGVDLQSNDIIVGIDGVMPRTPDDYFKRWETAKASNACRVNIQRDVDRFDLVWQVADSH